MEQPYDLNMFEMSQRRNVENLTKSQLINEFKCFLTEWKKWSDMPYRMFERMCLVSDRLSTEMELQNRRGRTQNRDQSIQDIITKLDDLYPEVEDDFWKL